MLTFIVTDGHASSSEQITDRPSQTPISCRSFVPMITQLAREGAGAGFTVIAGDADADPIVLSVGSGLPDGASSCRPRGEFVWTPGFDQQGEHFVTFAAQDPSATAVTHGRDRSGSPNVNRAPVDRRIRPRVPDRRGQELLPCRDRSRRRHRSRVHRRSGCPKVPTLDADTGFFSGRRARGRPASTSSR